MSHHFSRKSVLSWLAPLVLAAGLYSCGSGDSGANAGGSANGSACSADGDCASGNCTNDLCAGDGSLFRIGLRSDPDGPTVIFREMRLYVQDLYAGADPRYRIPVRIVTEYAWHSLFIRNLFVRPTVRAHESFEPVYTILDLPSLRADPDSMGTRGETVIALNLGEKLEMAKALVDLGVDVIEAGFPIASPGDFESVQEIARQTDLLALNAAVEAARTELGREYGGATKPHLQSHQSILDDKRGGA